jgi:hypothetical protein
VKLLFGMENKWNTTGSCTNTIGYSDGIVWTGLGNIIFNTGLSIISNGTILIIYQ